MNWLTQVSHLLTSSQWCIDFFKSVKVVYWLQESVLKSIGYWYMHFCIQKCRLSEFILHFAGQPVLGSKNVVYECCSSWWALQHEVSHQIYFGCPSFLGRYCFPPKKEILSKSSYLAQYLALLDDLTSQVQCSICFMIFKSIYRPNTAL